MCPTLSPAWGSRPVCTEAELQRGGGVGREDGRPEETGVMLKQEGEKKGGPTGLSLEGLDPGVPRQ